MSPWDEILSKPAGRLTDPLADAWFAQIARHLLHGARLTAGATTYRFVEVEAYYFSTEHPDPFTHRDPIQLEGGRWYFHRTRGMYRGGSFKGLDLAFGDGTAFGGMLIRGIESSDGTLIDGPSLCVDNLLSASGVDMVSKLDHAIGERPAWATEGPLVLSRLAEPEERPIYRTARVGLSLKRATPESDMPGYIVRRYRFLSEPKRTAKGKLHLVLALHGEGKSAEEIHEITGCPSATIRRYLRDYEAGTHLSNLNSLIGFELGPADLCKLHGALKH